MSTTDELPEITGYDRWRVAVSAAIGIAVAILLVLWVAGFDVFHENLFRIGPTIEGGGVGTDFQEGNDIGYLKGMITVVHLADVVMGLFILLMVVVHWASFRRLAARMRQPGEPVSDRGTPTDRAGEVSTDSSQSEPTGGDQ